MATPIPDASAWLVATKLQAPLPRTDTVRRPHLEEALSRSVSTLPLTLLSAPAGYGKTTLLASLPRLLPGAKLAWITLDAEENDPARFIGLLTLALQRLDPRVGASVWPLLAGGLGDGAGLKRAVAMLLNEVVQWLPEPFVLVLDDLHAVTEPAVHVALEHLLDHLPPQMHLAVGTRHDPPLRLARLAARRQLNELRRPDLQFTPRETTALLNETLGLSLSEAEVAELQARTEGWPAGLCLLAFPLGRVGSGEGRARFLAAVSSMERHALDFLADEVLTGLPEGLRHFLLQSAVLTEMTPSACQAVTGREDAAEVLEQLYRQNLTIAALGQEAGGEPVYRHHALFAQLLRRQLERELPGEVAGLHRRAAEAARTPGRAIAHYLAAGLWPEAARLMAQAGGRLLHSGMTETVLGWIGSLPEEARAAAPRLQIIMGACELHRGNFGAALRLYEAGRAACAAAGDAAGEGEALSAQLTVVMQGTELSAVARLVAEASALPLSPMARVRVLLSGAFLDTATDNWAGACAKVGEALAIPRVTGDRQADLVGLTFLSAPLLAVPGCQELTERYCAEAGELAPPDTAWRLGARELEAWLLLWRGKTSAATARATEAEALRQRLGGFPFVGNDLPVILGLLAFAYGDLEAAGQHTETLLRRMETAPRSRLSLYLHAAGRALALLGRHAEARAVWVRLSGLPGGLPFTAYLSEHLAGLLALLTGQRAEAAAVLERAVQLELQLPIAWVGGSARLLQASLLLEQGHPEAAYAIVTDLVAQWEHAGTEGCALLDGPAGLPALRFAARRGHRGAARLAALHSAAVEVAAANRAGTAAAALPEALTQRESDVLRLIAAGYTNPQIGKELFITVETVKSHVARILQKLGVSSRTQAATLGRDLGL